MDKYLRELKLLRVEDFIWIVYFFIVFLSLFSNNLERSYYLTGNKEYKTFFSKINTGILVIAFLIYFYFITVNFESIEILKRNRNNKKIQASFEGLISSLLFLFGGAFALLSDYHNNINDVTIALF